MSKTHKKIDALILILTIIWIIILLNLIISHYTTVDAMSKELENTKEDLLNKENIILDINSKLVIAESAVLEQYNINKDLNDIIMYTDSNLLKLKKINKKLKKELDNATNRLSIYEKYKYVALSDGIRTDVTYEQLVLGETLMLDYGYDPDLLFGILMVESGGNHDIINPISGASGYGQFMSCTGQYVYEKLLNKGNDYNHYYTPLNGDINIEMMAKYIDYLYQKYNNNIFSIIKEYCGGDSSFTKQYISKVNSVLPNNRYLKY